ncbi:MAG: tetratricopeptide repeat protein [Betaproteobacteria bacterium]|nr:tetratricopeptide repeat protein [Betaproteobacteria bacterium]
MLRRSVPRLLGAALFATFSAHAQLKPGEYVFERGRGVLKIAPGSGGAHKFHINTVGGNFHICTLEGVIRNGEARMAESAHDKLPCIVTFSAKKNGIAVASKHERACSTYCGVRAHFDGFYTLPPPNCEPSRVRHARNQFKAAYDQKRYTEALALLKPVLDQCGSLLHDYDDGWVRNDLAITHHRVGNNAACRDTLLRWVDLARQSDADIKDGFPPSDAEEMLRLARATRFNLKLCGAPLATSGKP